MIYDLLLLFLLVVATEAISEIVSTSIISSWFKQLIFNPTQPPSVGLLQNIKVWLLKLLDCGYCCSVWVGGLLALALPVFFVNQFVNWAIGTFVLHRLANWLHVIYELVRKGRISSYDIETKVQHQIIVPDSINFISKLLQQLLGQKESRDA